MNKGKNWSVLGAVILLTAYAACQCLAAVMVTEPEIADVKRFSQDPCDYISSTFKRNWIESKVQSQHADGSLLLFFNPWVQAFHLSAPDEKWGMDFFDVPRWGSNLKRIGKDDQDRLIAEADMENYPSMKRFAIITSDTDARILPTQKPAFGDPSKGGQGFPFDNLQNSRFRIGTPVVVYHKSKSGRWFLVQGPCFSGWVRKDDVAFVSNTFIRNYDSENYFVVISDGTLFADSKGRTVASADIGTLFPFAGKDKDGKSLLKIPVKADNGHAKIIKAYLKDGEVSTYPVAYNAANVSKVAGRLMESTYGWGGLYGNRDCSQMVQELYLPFGFLMPRNSGAQREAFRNISVKGMSPQEKIKAVKKYGTPFRTLLAFDGHVGIYAGIRNGEPLMMHCTWGVQLCDEEGTEGRAVIGKAVISTLRPGKELPNAVVDSLLGKLAAIVFLPGSVSDWRR